MSKGKASVVCRASHSAAGCRVAETAQFGIIGAGTFLLML